MSCIFCNSSTHLSQNCDVFVSDDSRIKNLITNNRCDSCLSSLDDNTHSTDACFLQVKCYICFMQMHHTVYCPDRFSGKINHKILNSIFFKPKIDSDLFPRFLHLFNLSEQYAVASFDALKNLNLKPLKVITHLTIDENYILKYSDSVFIVTHVLKINLRNKGIAEYASNHIFVNAVIINMENSRIQSEHCFRFISCKTRKLYCNNLQFISNVAFADILNRLPEIEEMNFQESNLDFGLSWPQELLQSENARNLQTLSFTLKDNNFCAKTLAAFMRKNNKILITIYCDNVKLLAVNLSTYFYAPQDTNEGSLLKLVQSSIDHFPHIVKFYRPIMDIV